MLQPQSDPWHVSPVVIDAIRQETRDIKTYTIRSTDSATAQMVPAKAGQFNMLYLPGIGEAAISISKHSPIDHAFVHTIRAVGNVTRALDRATEGFTFGVRGPFGSSWPIEECRDKHLIVVAGGIGLAPLRPVIHQAIRERDRFGALSVFIGARSPADLLYTREYDQWEAAGALVKTTVDRSDGDWTGHVGVVTLLLNRMKIPDPSQTIVFCCGPEVMMNYAIDAAQDQGVPQENLWLSLERNMNCAIGHCGHCQLGPHFVCKDGPVFRHDKVADLMRVDSL